MYLANRYAMVFGAVLRRTCTADGGTHQQQRQFRENTGTQAGSVPNMSAAAGVSN